MNMTFDALKYARDLENAGFSRQQAEVQAEAFRKFSEIQEERTRIELATKADVKKAVLQLQKEIKDVELRLLKWQIGGWIGLAAIMAKGFGWLGF